MYSIEEKKRLANFVNHLVQEFTIFYIFSTVILTLNSVV